MNTYTGNPSHERAAINGTLYRIAAKRAIRSVEGMRNYHGAAARERVLEKLTIMEPSITDSIEQRIVGLEITILAIAGLYEKQSQTEQCDCSEKWSSEEDANVPPPGNRGSGNMLMSLLRGS